MVNYSYPHSARYGVGHSLCGACLYNAPRDLPAVSLHDRTGCLEAVGVFGGYFGFLPRVSFKMLTDIEERSARRSHIDVSAAGGAVLAESGRFGEALGLQKLVGGIEVIDVYAY